MCTVTFIPFREKVFISSNRDEKSSRSLAFPPEAYDFGGSRIFFPKDSAAGGTWFAVHENGNVLVLLNGAFKFHLSAPPYNRSRGLVLLELIQHESPFNFFRSIHLEEIEPFTVIVWERENLFECQWDGEKKYAKQLDKSAPHIWSSATLYNEEVTNKRKSWFHTWLQERKEFSLTDVLAFHQFTGDGDSENDLNMKRSDQLLTVSVTCLEREDATARLAYLDLISNKTYLQPIEFNQEWAGR